MCLSRQPQVSARRTIAPIRPASTDARSLFYGQPINAFAFEELPRLFGGIGIRVQDPARLRGALQEGYAAAMDMDGPPLPMTPGNADPASGKPAESCPHVGVVDPGQG